MCGNTIWHSKTVWGSSFRYADTAYTYSDITTFNTIMSWDCAHGFYECRIKIFIDVCWPVSYLPDGLWANRACVCVCVCANSMVRVTLWCGLSLLELHKRGITHIYTSHICLNENRTQILILSLILFFNFRIIKKESSGKLNMKHTHVHLKQNIIYEALKQFSAYFIILNNGPHK